MDGRSRLQLTTAMKKLTELDNPNSVQQMKQWLADGLETNTLGKKAVAELFENGTGTARQCGFSLRQQLAKSSVRKYKRWKPPSAPVARGMFQFYGANRTGRWAGRLIQMQNLPQNHLPDLEQARALVRCGDYEALELLYEDVPRHTFTAYPHRFCAKSRSQIYRIRLQRHRSSCHRVVRQ